MENYIKDWTKYTLSVPTDRGDLTVKWSNVNELAKWSNIQAGLYLQPQPSSLQLFFEYFTKWYIYFWEQRHKQGLFDLPDGAKIMDIGSGVAVIDLLLASYIPDSKFYLVDKEGFEFRPGVYYDPEYPVYNSWAPVVDAIQTTGIATDRFSMIGEQDKFPEDLDCITSYLSWCWHYPKDIYWDKAFNSLKKGGRLILDVRALEGRDVIGEITEAMKCDPVLHPFDKKLPKHVDNMAPPDGSSVSGWRAMWTKNI
jgi:SAM-dependent methyltransferase